MYTISVTFNFKLTKSAGYMTATVDAVNAADVVEPTVVAARTSINQIRCIVS
jgi:hypothetical protein